MPTKKQRALSKDQKALLAVEFKELPPRAPGKRGSRGLKRLTKRYAVSKEYPAKMLRKLKLEKKLPSRSGVGGCDLGFNKSLDSRLPRVRDFNLDKFEEQILEAWDEYPSEKLDDLFDMKSRVLQCILSSNPPGGNNFAMPHRSADEK